MGAWDDREAIASLRSVGANEPEGAAVSHFYERSVAAAPIVGSVSFARVGDRVDGLVLATGGECVGGSGANLLLLNPAHFKGLAGNKSDRKNARC